MKQLPGLFLCASQVVIFASRFSYQTRAVREGEVDVLQSFLRCPRIGAHNSFVLLRLIVDALVDYAMERRWITWCDGQEHDGESGSRGFGRLSLGKHLQVRRLLLCLFVQGAFLTAGTEYGC
uniref:Uncharacterized protein n=1 Tax=Ixodes ricinus TaxID=34613 RepID=A0A6B0UPK4_IXORI